MKKPLLPARHLIALAACSAVLSSCNDEISLRVVVTNKLTGDVIFDQVAKHRAQLEVPVKVGQEYLVDATVTADNPYVAADYSTSMISDAGALTFAHVFRPGTQPIDFELQASQNETPNVMAMAVSVVLVPNDDEVSVTVAIVGTGTVEVNAQPCSSGTCTHSFPMNFGPVVLQVPAPSQADFIRWEGGCGEQLSPSEQTDPSVEIDIGTDDVDCRATFARSVQLNVEVAAEQPEAGYVTAETFGGADPVVISCGAGRLFCSATGIEPGTEVALTAHASPGFIFAGWSGNCTSTEETVRLTLLESASCTARFRQPTNCSEPLSELGEVAVHEGVLDSNPLEPRVQDPAHYTPSDEMDILLVAAGFQDRPYLNVVWSVGDSGSPPNFAGPPAPYLNYQAPKAAGQTPKPEQRTGLRSRVTYGVQFQVYPVGCTPLDAATFTSDFVLVTPGT